ncbi:hypothetical protein HDE_12465 [Halotydeus destructor]|nr:hypothetical protein HDE_12465 [Halotydeus destructor]
MLFFSTRKQKNPVLEGVDMSLVKPLREVELCLIDPFSGSLRSWSASAFKAHLRKHGLLGGTEEHQRKQATFLMSYWWLSLKEVCSNRYEVLQPIMREVTLMWGCLIYEFLDALTWTEKVFQDLSVSRYVYNECAQIDVHPEINGYLEFLTKALQHPRHVLRHLAENAFYPYEKSKIFTTIVMVAAGRKQKGKISNTSSVGKTTLLRAVMDRVPDRCIIAGHELFNLPLKYVAPKNKPYLEGVTIEENRFLLVMDDLSIEMLLGKPSKITTEKQFLRSDPPFEGLRTIISTNMPLIPLGDEDSDEESNARELDRNASKASRAHAEYDLAPFLERFQIYGMRFVSSTQLVEYQNWIRSDMALRIVFGNTLHRIYCDMFSKRNNITPPLRRSSSFNYDWLPYPGPTMDRWNQNTLATNDSPPKCGQRNFQSAVNHESADELSSNNSSKQVGRREARTHHLPSSLSLAQGDCTIQPDVSIANQLGSKKQRLCSEVNVREAVASETATTSTTLPASSQPASYSETMKAPAGSRPLFAGNWEEFWQPPESTDCSDSDRPKLVLDGDTLDIEETYLEGLERCDSAFSNFD